MNILCLDAGSSSLKFASYSASDAAARRVLRGAAENLGRPTAKFWTERAGGDRSVEKLPDGAPDFATVLGRIVEACAATELGEPAAIGHRIVFGGPDHMAPAIVDARLLSDLEGYIPFDRLHLRTQLELVRAVAARFPSAPQVLCFDSAFHHRMPEVARRIPLPRSVGPLVRRYGYHGLSYEYIVATLGSAAAGRVLIAHLGSGASLAAVRDGNPIDTTMGFSPLGGLMMSTRPGDIDPGVLLYLITIGTSTSDVELLLDERSGLLGVSEVTGSMEELLNLATENAQVREAIELFVYQLRKHIGAMVAVLGGLDTLVFTGGIGEHAAPIRALVADGLLHLGISLDSAANARHDGIISNSKSAVTVRVIATDEAVVIARHVRRILQPTG